MTLSDCPATKIRSR